MPPLSTQQVIAATIAIGAVVAFYIYRSTQQSSKSCKTCKDKTKYGDNRLMKLNSIGTNQIQLKLPPTLALVTDLDHTLFGGNVNETHAESNQHILRFNDIWCTQYAQNCLNLCDRS